MTEAKKHYRWKRDAPMTGLRSIGAGPRCSKYHCGDGDYVARTGTVGGNWAREFEGWFFTARVGEEFINSYSEKLLYNSEAEAKRAAEVWVKERL